MQKSVGKMSNMELLRSIAMMMVVMLHFLGKGNLLGDVGAADMSDVGVAAWMLESFSLVAVNVYMLISGYFLCTSDFKLSRLIKIWIQVFTYSFVVGVIAYLTNVPASEDFGIHYMLTIMLPISMNHYWFMTAYVFLYMLMPILTRAVNAMNRKQHRSLIIILLFMFSFAKSLLPFRTEIDSKGYDVIWYICVFMLAAYIRKYGLRFISGKLKGFLIYLIFCLLIFGLTFALRAIYLKTGSFELILTIGTEYNHIFVLLASMGLVGLFLNISISGKVGNIINIIGGYTLGVYLLHENIGVRYAWPQWLGASKISNVMELLAYAVTAVVIVFVVGILVESVRSCLMNVMDKLFERIKPYRRVKELIYRADRVFRKESAE